MSDLCMYELEDVAWDEFCRSDDHLVPLSDCERPVDHHSIQGDSHKKPWHEMIILSNNTEDKSTSGHERKGLPASSKRRNAMMEKDPCSRTPCGVFPSPSESDLIKEASSLASENTASQSLVTNDNKKTGEHGTTDVLLSNKATAVEKSSFIDPISDMSFTVNNSDISEGTLDKDTSDFLYYDLPEIENFEDVDRMFRSCDSTFDFVDNKDDELGWLMSADNTEGSGDGLRTDFKFPCPEANLVEKVNRQEKRFKPQDPSSGKRQEHYFMNGSLNYINNQPSDVMQIPSEATSDQPQPLQQKRDWSPNSVNYLQNPLSYVHSDNCHLSGLTSVCSTLPSVKSQTDVTSIKKRSMDSSSDPRFQVLASGSERRKKLHSGQGSLSSANGNLKKTSSALQAATGNPGMIGTQVHKVDNHSDVGLSLVIPGELGSSTIQESSTLSSVMDDFSLEAASFHQLQLVMEQLDLRTKLCIRDSLYRLARSAEQRHNHVNFGGRYAGETDAGGAFIAEGTNNFMDMETDTNPIDRSIAHLLFHRPSESSATPAGDSFPFKSSNVVRGSVTSAPVMVENSGIFEETASDVDKVTNT